MLARVSEAKLRAVEEAVGLLRGHEVVCAADLYKLESAMLQDLRRKLRGQMAVKCIKGNLIRIAVEKAGLRGAEEFLRRAAGQNIYLFSNENPFRLAMMLERSKVKTFAKPGDLATSSIVIPAGNTGIAPGPVISRFGALGVKTRIEGGNIWITQDAEVARPGDKISEDLAAILTRLGLKVAEMGLRIKAAYDRGSFIHGEMLSLDLNAFRSELARSQAEALHLALAAEYPTPQTVPILIAMAAERARRVAVEAEYTTAETARELVARAHARALALERLVTERGEKTAS